MGSGATRWIFAAGVFDLALAAFHLGFWRIFGWPASLAGSGSVNRGITQILNLAIAYLFTLAGLVCLLYAPELAGTGLGRFWLVAMTGFWLARALIQPPFFGLGRAFSVVLFFVFSLGAVLHGVAWALVRGG